MVNYMDEQNAFEKLQIRAEDLFREATYEELFGNHLFESQEQEYYLFPSSHIGDAVWLVENGTDNEYEVLRAKNANKQQVVPQYCSFYHCEPIDRTWLEDNRVKDIETKIKNGGKLLAKKVNKAYVDVLAKSVSESVQVQNGQLDEVLADVFSKQVKDGFRPNKFLFPEHLEAKLLQQGFIVRDEEIQNRHYVGKTITGQQAFSSNDLPAGMAILFDSAVGITLIKNPKFSVERLKAFVLGVCGYYGTNLIIKNVSGVIAIEGIDQALIKKSGNIPVARSALDLTLYIDPARLLEIKEITSAKYDLSKLI